MHGEFLLVNSTYWKWIRTYPDSLMFIVDGVYNLAINYDKASQAL